MDVVHVSGGPTDPDALALACGGMSKAAVIVADRECDSLSDAVAVDVSCRLREMAAAAGRPAPIVVAECVDDRNRGRLVAAGCAAAVRPMRSYPEMLARALAAPGSEELLENLFTAEGDELHRVALPGGFRGRWADLACPLLISGIGTALAYEKADGTILANPSGTSQVEASAVFLVVHVSQMARIQEVPLMLQKGIRQAA